MDRRRRTMILIKGRPQLAQEMAEDIIRKYEVKVIEKPHTGLVMVKVRESARQSLFYLGEILVTECKVQINGILGVGIVQDFQTQLAYHLAVIDGAYNANLEEVKAWAPLLWAEEKEILAREAREMAGVLKTKVDFTTMDQ
ncbi:MAG: phosphonate C-P lyase system protein PhnG [Bacillota bacterium]|uniref:Phosphonate C-P lyase system protein PhnG n=1 Tax=Thermanaerosceptrum fracticalcis TaxID=1712410 RepID=A0A7G6DYS5_THEFR|nr:phosphonate C-P lyase system protein PhnG [Thermanaerosceptrum fracticalcis]QNB44979.1 phosphonate C-P lyase system protein PhnG [Thermanaerosceptrum fracticalcis]